MPCQKNVSANIIFLFKHFRWKTCKAKAVFWRYVGPWYNWIIIRTFAYLLSPWDYAAASLIVTEAGGVITSSDGSNLRLTEPTGVIAANTFPNHQQLLDIVASVQL